jgi:predicted thioesterase
MKIHAHTQCICPILIGKKILLNWNISLPERKATDFRVRIEKRMDSANEATCNKGNVTANKDKDYLSLSPLAPTVVTYYEH